MQDFAANEKKSNHDLEFLRWHDTLVVEIASVDRQILPAQGKETRDRIAQGRMEH